jgi:hypothetical protein
MYPGWGRFPKNIEDGKEFQGQFQDFSQRGRGRPPLAMGWDPTYFKHKISFTSEDVISTNVNLVEAFHWLSFDFNHTERVL